MLDPGGRTLGFEIGELNDLAVRGLVTMFDAESRLFCYRLRCRESGWVQEGLSHRYTMMTLLGLHQYEVKGKQSPVEVRPVLERLLDDTGWIDNLGDLGLLLWACALLWPERLRRTCASVDVRSAIHRFREGREGRTMELAWLLSGIAHARLAWPGELPELTDLAAETYRLLKKNHGKHGIFGHLARNRTFAGALRGHIGSFADQVYPIYALTKFAEAYRAPAALQMARTCAEAICQAQGPLGQWWWHYNSATGKVFERYPVYSVHQDGMAPMALFALGEATQADFTEPIYRGLRWIAGQNELGCDLRVPGDHIIWRSVFHGSRHRRISSRARTAAGLGRSGESTEDLKTTFECRPYHFGWLLYAFAGREAASPAAPESPCAVGQVAIKR